MLPEIIHISRNGQMLGSFHRDAIKAGLENHTYLPDDLAWYEGAAGWAPLHTLEGFATAPAPSSSTPPLPPPVIPPTPPATPPPVPPASGPPPVPRQPVAATVPKKRGCAGLLIFLMLFLFLLLAGAGFYGYKTGLLGRLKSLVQPHHSVTRYEPTTTSTPPLPSVPEFEASEFTRAYDLDPKHADALYMHKTITLAGPVEEAGISVINPGQPYAVLKAGRVYVSCYFPATAKAAVTSLRRGQNVKIRGDYIRSTGAYDLERCTLVSVDPNSPATSNSSSSAVNGTELQATEFYRAFTDKPAESDRLYKNKTLTLVGAVELASVNPMGQVFVLLKAGGSDYVTCMFPATAKSTVTSLREGQNVKIRGECTGLVYGAFGLQNCTLVK